MIFRFKKALQAAMLFLYYSEEERKKERAIGSEHNKMTVYRLNQFLYILDRESIKETGHSVTGDEAILKTFPQPWKLVLKTVDKLLSFSIVHENREEVGIWNEFINNDGFNIELRGSVNFPKNFGTLNRYEIGKIKEIFIRHDKLNGNEIAHKMQRFEEFLEFENGIPVSFKLRYEAVGCDSDYQNVLKLSEEERKDDEVLGISDHFKIDDLKKRN
jgi:hypothetical protein